MHQLQDLVALPIDEAERRDTGEQVRLARACTAEVPLTRMRTVRRKLRVFKRSAEPGPSGWRNGMLQLIGKRPIGCEALTRFCRAYSRGSLTAAESILWSSVCLVPLDKGGGKLRPIALGEALPKLAQATLFDTIGNGLRRAFEPQQLSVRVPGGAETLARTLRAWTRGGRRQNPPPGRSEECLWENAQEQSSRSSTPAMPSPCSTVSPAVGARHNVGVDQGRRNLEHFSVQTRRMAREPRFQPSFLP